MPTTFSAPYPTLKVTVVMPNAQFEDGRAPESSVDVKRSMVGDTFTYVKTSDRQQLRLRYTLTKMKALELQAFIRIYYRAEWRIGLHDNTTWIGSLAVNPFDGRTTQRAGGQPGGEAVEVVLLFSARRA